MAESQKEAASTSKSQKKVSILDDEFGINFLGSWKSMAVAKDDGLDFGAEVAPRGKKNAFDFDKLDMDFSLDGDFGSKLSSFKVDMADLDFSSSPKKPAKPKEKSAKETNHGWKQDRFSFSFNFNELDNFDLDSSLMKTEKKSDKVPDDKHIGSPGNLEMNQSPRRNLVTSADAPEDGPTNKLPEPERLATSKVDPLIGKNDTSLSVSTDLGSLNASHDGMRTIPEKEIMSCTKETSGHSEQSERMVSTEPNPQETIQDSSMRSVTNDDSIQDVPELQVEVCSSATEVISNQEEEQDINGKKLCNMECSPTSRSPDRTHNEFTNKLENQTSVATGDINMDGSMQGDTHTEDASVAIATVDMLSTTTTHENKSTCNLPVAPLRSDPKSHKLLPMELKDTGNMQSKPLDQSEGNGSELNTPAISNKIKPVVNENRHLSLADPRQECNAFYAQSGSKKFDYSKSHVRAAMEGVPAGLESDKDNVIHKLTASENKSHKLLPTILMKPDSTQSKPLSQSGANESQLNTAAIPKKINHLLNKIEIAHSNHTDARKEINVSDVQAGSQKIDSSNLHDRAVTKGVPDELGSNKDNKVNKLSASFKVHSAGLMEQKFETKTFKGLNSRLHVSSIPAIQNLKSTYVEGNKLSPLEAGKKAFNVTSAKLSRPATPKTLLQSNLQTEAKSLQRLDRKAVMLISPAAKLGHAGTPTMKRKISEVPKEYPVNPVKRITGSPLEERDSPTTYENADNKRVRNNENLLGSCYFSPTSDIRRDASMKEFEVPLLMEDDGIIEKAEACAKELDNICNILKKKHEEAKEILVRAVVNNNNLLMLNHPVHEEKIQMVHRLASRLSRELQI